MANAPYNYEPPEWFPHAGQEKREEYLCAVITKLKEELLEYKQQNDPLNPAGRDRVLNQERELVMIRAEFDKVTLDLARLMNRVEKQQNYAVGPGACAPAVDPAGMRLVEDYDREAQ